MAIGTGRKQSEFIQKLYTGVTNFHVLAVNPTKEELSEIYSGAEVYEPEYLTTSEDGIEQLKITFYLKTVEEPNIIIPVTYFMNNKSQISKGGDKVKVISPYGITSYISIEDAKNKVVPERQPFLGDKYRACFEGEGEVTEFIKLFMNIPALSFTNKKTGEVITIEVPADAECRFDDIPNWFKGNISSLKDTVKAGMALGNKIKFVVGVRTTSENKQYQQILKEVPMRPNLKDFTKAEEALANKVSFGAYGSTEFGFTDGLVEYKVTPTEFESTSTTTEDYF